MNAEDIRAPCVFVKQGRSPSNQLFLRKLKYTQKNKIIPLKE